MRADRVEVYDDAAGRVRWRYVAFNGHVLADSGQSYSRVTDCRRAAMRVVGRHPRHVRLVRVKGERHG